MPKLYSSHPAFNLFGSELRMRVALAFVPDPEEPVTVGQIADTVGLPTSTVFNSIYMLHNQGLLLRGTLNQLGHAEFTRIETPL